MMSFHKKQKKLRMYVSRKENSSEKKAIDYSEYATRVSTGLVIALMCASAMDVPDLNGDVQSRLLPSTPDAIDVEPSANLGSALMCASAIDVPERYAADGLPCDVENELATE